MKCMLEWVFKILRASFQLIDNKKRSPLVSVSSSVLFSGFKFIPVQGFSIWLMAENQCSKA